MSWNEQLSTSEVISLRFRTNATGRVSDLLQLEDAIDFRDEVYLANLTVRPVFLTWRDQSEIFVTTSDEGADGEADF